MFGVFRGMLNLYIYCIGLAFSFGAVDLLKDLAQGTAKLHAPGLMSLGKFNRMLVGPTEEEKEKAKNKKKGAKKKKIRTENQENTP